MARALLATLFTRLVIAAPRPRFFAPPPPRRDVVDFLRFDDDDDLDLLDARAALPPRFAVVDFFEPVFAVAFFAPPRPPLFFFMPPLLLLARFFVPAAFAMKPPSGDVVITQ
jgi:hypothetical protein